VQQLQPLLLLPQFLQQHVREPLQQQTVLYLLQQPQLLRLHLVQPFRALLLPQLPQLPLLLRPLFYPPLVLQVRQDLNSLEDLGDKQPDQYTPWLH
jgi:hypothetical protein